MTDRERVAVVLQAGSVLSHLRLAGWGLADDWTGARLDGQRLLRSVTASEGATVRWPQTALIALIDELFDGRSGEVAGRGQARRALRRLVDGWRQTLVPLSPDAAVRDLLSAAPFLWNREHAAARAALAAEHRRGDSRRLWVAGPSELRRRMLAGVGDWSELRRRLAAADSKAGLGAAGAAGEGGLSRARRQIDLGRYESALALLDSTSGPRSDVLRIACKARLGRLEAARRALRRCPSKGLTTQDRVELAETATWLSGCRGRPKAAEPWLSNGLRAERQPERSRAHLVAAEHAWDRRDLAGLERALSRARPALERPELAWRWRQIAALGALERRRPEQARRELERALADSRRGLSAQQAGSLWNDLAVARADGGDLVSAERAMLHAVRLHAEVEGPRGTTLALCNLAELRLRRGSLRGVREILSRSIRENLEAGNARALAYDRELECRYELIRGRPDRAIDRVRAALTELDRAEGDWRRSELHVVAARACGWLGRRKEAARHLATAGDPAGALEPEELPALYALAGVRDSAMGCAQSTPEGVLWSAALEDRDPPPTAWCGLDRLEPFRAARLVADLELARPGLVPRPRLLAAAEALEQCESEYLLGVVRRALEGAWVAVERYLQRPASGEQELARLFEEAGFPNASLTFVRGSLEHEVLAGAGGGETLEAEVASGRLVLRADRIDGALRVLFALVIREWRPASRLVPAGREPGVIGDSPPLLRAMDRIRRFAGSDIPVLIQGESGTGKELAARTVHRRSARAAAPFLPINSAALTESLVLSELFGHVRGAFTGAERDRPGVFEAARGGTVFLDEIGDLPARAQAMLLRVLQEGEVRRIGENRVRRVDARLVAATHRRLERRVERGLFREDLYYRLAVGRVELPPLRERGDDLELLIEHFLVRFAPGARLALSPRALDRLRAHTWPGNVRELGNCLAVAVALASDGTLRVRDLELPEASSGRLAGGYHQRVLDFRRRLVRDALRDAGGNRAAAARRLGVSRQALSYLVRSLGLT